MTKMIAVEPVKTIAGAPYKVAVLNKLGEIQFESESVVKMKDGNTVDLIRQATYFIPKPIQAKMDSHRIGQMMYLLDDVEEKKLSEIPMPDKLYDWLWDLLARPMPIKKSEKEENITEKNYSQQLYGVHYLFIQETMKDKTVRKTTAQLLEDE